MTLSTNSFDEFHCQAADNFDTKEENESSKYFYHKILNIWEFSRSLNDVRLYLLYLFIFGIRKIINMFPVTCIPGLKLLQFSSSAPSLNLLPPPKSPGGPSLNLPNFSSAAQTAALDCGQLYTVARCTDSRQASSAAQTRREQARSCRREWDVLEWRALWLSSDPILETKQGKNEAIKRFYVNNTHWQETRIVYECVRRTFETREHLKLQKINGEKAKSLLLLCNGRVSVY